MSENIHNRRKHVRVYRNFILSYHLKGSNEDKREMSQVNNISRGGINFSSTHVLNVGDQLVIELKTPFLSDKIDLHGIVLESRPKIANLIYAVRVQFQELTDAAKDVLAKIEQYSTAQEQ